MSSLIRFGFLSAGTISIGISTSIVAGAIQIWSLQACTSSFARSVSRHGQVFPTDATYIHYGKGQMETDLTLSLGRHTLCLQAADGAHVVLGGDGLHQTITITVK